MNDTLAKTTTKTQLSLMVDHHKSKYPVKVLDFCVRGHGHIRHLQCQLTFDQTQSSELLNLS